MSKQQYTHRAKGINTIVTNIFFNQVNPLCIYKINKI